MSYKNKKAQGLSLTFKEEFELSELFISSYADDKININNINYDFPICIFRQKIFDNATLECKISPTITTFLPFIEPYFSLME